jgi:hypothetical protein
MWNEAVSQESAEGMETGPIEPESDDEVVAYTAHRRLVILAGKCAQAEQLGKATRASGRSDATARLKRRPPGVCFAA